MQSFFQDDSWIIKLYLYSLFLVERGRMSPKGQDTIQSFYIFGKKKKNVKSLVFKYTKIK